MQDAAVGLFIQGPSCQQQRRGIVRAVDTSCPPVRHAHALRPEPRPHRLLGHRHQHADIHPLGARPRRHSLPCQAMTAAPADAVASPTWWTTTSPIKGISVCSGTAATGGRSTSPATPARPRAPKAVSATHAHRPGGWVRRKQIALKTMWVGSFETQPIWSILKIDRKRKIHSQWT